MWILWAAANYYFPNCQCSSQSLEGHFLFCWSTLQNPTTYVYDDENEVKKQMINYIINYLSVA